MYTVYEFEFKADYVFINIENYKIPFKSTRSTALQIYL